MQLEEIKEKALANRVPIIMDDTLEKIVELLKEAKPKRLLEIGPAPFEIIKEYL